ncbi:helix-turn-helix domain-containing protein [Alicyclobacillus macrosporangiidus]|uniref:helix-turn-helix domain-containing protein n=1 Tax=Alicyclobacillus macrosporangiidus TaxID=392015 RepID=UPI001E48DEEE|nr:helix-turn-helix transcriptional regulator [Alicyclobacillus macrosporangiidus]
MSFPERLMTLRSRFHLTKKALAEAVGLSERLVYYYEQGQRSPNMETLIALADFFDVSIDYLVGRSDDPTPPRKES